MTARLPLLGLALVVALLAAVPAALAAEGEAEITRAEYIAKVEPICAANTKANSKILKGVKQQVVKRQACAGRQTLHPRLLRLRQNRQAGSQRFHNPLPTKRNLTTWLGI